MKTNNSRRYTLNQEPENLSLQQTAPEKRPIETELLLGNIPSKNTQLNVHGGCSPIL